MLLFRNMFLASSIDFIPNLFLFASCRTLLEKQGASDELLATVGDDINVSHRVIMHSLITFLQINWLIISWVVGNIKIFVGPTELLPPTYNS